MERIRVVRAHNQTEGLNQEIAILERECFETDMFVARIELALELWGRVDFDNDTQGQCILRWSRIRDGAEHISHRAPVLRTAPGFSSEPRGSHRPALGVYQRSQLVQRTAPLSNRAWLRTMAKAHTARRLARDQI